MWELTKRLSLRTSSGLSKVEPEPDFYTGSATLRWHPCIYVRKYIYFFFYLFLGFYIIYTVLQCDLPPLRSHCGEAPGRDSNPGRAGQRQGHYP